MMPSFTDEELEQLLRTQPLRAPSAELDRRVQAELRRPPLPLRAGRGEGKEWLALDTSQEQPETQSSSALTLALSQPRKLERGPRRWRLPLALAACLALAVGLWLISERRNRATHPVPAPLVNAPGDAAPSLLADFNPVRIEEVWSRVAPDGVVSFDGDNPVRRYRQRTLQHVQLIDEDRNIRIEYTAPRDDLFVTPVRFD